MWQDFKESWKGKKLMNKNLKELSDALENLNRFPRTTSFVSREHLQRNYTELLDIANALRNLAQTAIEDKEIKYEVELVESTMEPVKSDAFRTAKLPRRIITDSED